MNQLNPKEIERKLADRPAPPPPPELLEKIQAEIPEPSEVWGDAEATPPSRQRRWLIAASVVIAVGGGLLGYRTFQETDVEDLAADPSGRSAAIEDRAPLGTPEAAVESLRENIESAAEPPPDEAPGTSDVDPARSQQIAPATADPVDRQRSAGPLSVVVKDPDGNSLPGVSVELSGPGEKRLQVTNVDGETEFRELDEGEWELEATLSGFDSVENRDVDVRESGATTVEVELQPAVEESITVTSEAPLLDERRVSAGATISEVEPESRRARREQQQELAKPKARPAPPQSPSTALHDAAAMVVAEPRRPPPSPQPAPPSTGGTHEPNDQPYGDVFFREYGVNPFLDTEDDALSTFGLDVDTGSYSITRRYLDDGNLPPREAIRVEEFLNYFDYRDAAPRQGDFAIHADLAPAPFATGERYQLLRFGIRGREISDEDRKPATLIFVVDVSGSMAREDRLGLVKRSLVRLLDQLREEDRVGLVIYGSTGKVLLAPTGDHHAIRNAIGELQPGGSTNAEHGLKLAYDLASGQFRREAINRIILCSDGVANVGATGPESILERVRREAERGIELTTVGFGMGNYNDVLMEQLADQGDGNYAYVDDLAEADRIFVENLTGTLQTIASDAKVQVEFNPETVSRYRLLGYENRDVADDRFRDDTVDAGEIGAGHSVVALYEIKLHEMRPKRAPLATIHLRWRSKETGEVVEIERPVSESDGVERWKNAPDSLKLAAAVAEFAELLKGSYWAKDGDFEAALAVAQEASAGYAGDKDVAELVGLIAKAAKLRSGEPRRGD